MRRFQKIPADSKHPLGTFRMRGEGRSAKKTLPGFSEPSPNILSLSRSSTSDSCTVRETDCCHSNYICTQLGMCLCASASVSPWPSTDQTPALGEVPREACAAGRGLDGPEDSVHDVQVR